MRMNMLKNQGPSKTYSHQCGLVRSVADFTSCWSIGWTWLNGIGNPDVTGRLVISKGPRILTKAVDGSYPWMSGEPNWKEHTLGACWNCPTRKISLFQLIMFHPPKDASNVYIIIYLYIVHSCAIFFGCLTNGAVQWFDFCQAVQGVQVLGWKRWNLRLNEGGFGPCQKGWARAKANKSPVLIFIGIRQVAGGTACLVLGASKGGATGLVAQRDLLDLG